MINVFSGPMFSGKSSLLIEEYNKIWNKKNILCFKPVKDTRDNGVLKTRNSEEGIPSVCINDLKEIKKFVNKNTKTIFIDEIQFINGDAQELLNLSIKKEIDIYVAGLNLTSEQKNFGIMPSILAIADEITITKAVCFDCNKPIAAYTYYENDDKSGEILVGNDGYIPLCGKCLNSRHKKKKTNKVR
jgi:thymidine kinase